MYVLINPNRRLDSYIVEKDVNNGKITFDENGKAYIECSEQKAKEYASILDAEWSKVESEVSENQFLSSEPQHSPKRNQKTR